jgi:hypothetical protein
VYHYVTALCVTLCDGIARDAAYFLLILFAIIAGDALTELVLTQFPVVAVVTVVTVVFVFPGFELAVVVADAARC